MSVTLFFSGISCLLISLLKIVSASSLESMPLFSSFPHFCFPSLTVFLFALNTLPSTIDTSCCSAQQWILALFYLHLQAILIKVRWVSDSLLFPADSSLKTTNVEKGRSVCLWLCISLHASNRLSCKYFFSRGHNLAEEVIEAQTNDQHITDHVFIGCVF